MNALMARPGTSFGNALRLFFKRYVDFKGRSSRSEYWYVVLAVIVSYFAWAFSIVLISELEGTTGVPRDNPDAMPPTARLVLFMMPLAMLAIIVPSISIGIRRIRDTGNPPLLYLLVLVPIGNFCVLFLLCQPSAPYPINGIPAADNPKLQAYGQFGDPTQRGNPHYGQSPYAAQPKEIYGQQPPQAPYGQAPQAPYGQAPQAPYGQAPQAPYGQTPQAPYGQAAPAPQQPQAPYGNQPPQAPYGS